MATGDTYYGEVTGLTFTYPDLGPSWENIGIKNSSEIERVKQNEALKMHLPALVTNSDKWFGIATNGNVDSFEDQAAAVKWARNIVARDDSCEVVVAKATNYVRIDKPVIVDEVE